MILAVGDSHITLKKIMRQMGFPIYVGPPVVGVFNTSYTPTTLLDRIPAPVRNLPMINKNIVVNKLSALQKMAGAGLEEHIPEYRTYGPIPVGEDWIIKPYASQAGRGIRAATHNETIPNGFYAQRNVGKYREFRAHVGLWLDAPVFTIQEKKPKPELWTEVFGLHPNTDGSNSYTWPIENVDKRNRLPITWNIESGFYFRRSTTPENREDRISRFSLFSRIESLAIKAIKAIGYQYGAVDILMDNERKLFVTEVNSHPAIKNEDSINIYRIALEPLKTISQDAIIRLVAGTSGTTTHTLTRGAVS